MKLSKDLMNLRPGEVVGLSNETWKKIMDNPGYGEPTNRSSLPEDQALVEIAIAKLGIEVRHKFATIETLRQIVLPLQALFSPGERLAFWRELQQGYCLGCGAKSFPWRQCDCQGK